MSVYGNMLPFFSELQVEVDYYEQTPAIGAGYSQPTPVSKIYIIYQNTAEGSSISGPLGRLAKRANWSNMTITEEKRVWTEAILNEGGFIFDARKNRTYRVMKHLDWMDEGSFKTYLIEKVVGNKGSEQPLPIKAGVF